MYQHAHRCGIARGLDIRKETLLADGREAERGVWGRAVTQVVAGWYDGTTGTGSASCRSRPRSP